VVFDEYDRDELLATADESLDRLVRLVENLLDMSRLQAGALGTAVQAMSVAEAAATAVEDLGGAGRDVGIRVPDDLAEINADPALLERILANLLANALRYSPPGRPPMLTASEHGGYVEIRIVDHGPGIPVADRDRVFLPFQRLGDRSNDSGVGLGLALSRGLAEAMGGDLFPDTTPGGGLTMTLRLPVTVPSPVDNAADPAALARIEQWHSGAEETS
jgi:two-component system sensor histidine kinase KdpD